MFPTGLFGKWQAGCLVKRFQVAKIIEHCCCSAEILIAGVVIDGDVSLDACGEAGAQAVIGVFQIRCSGNPAWIVEFESLSLHKAGVRTR